MSNASPESQSPPGRSDTRDYRSALADYAVPIRWVGGACWVLAAVVLLFSTGFVLSGETELGVAPFVPTVTLLALGYVLRVTARRLGQGQGPGLPTVVGMAFIGVGGAMVLGGIFMAVDDPAGLVLLAFGLLFIAAGYLAWKLFAAPSGR